MGVQAVFVVVLMFAATVKADSGGVTFSGKKVILTCPEKGVWYDSGGKSVSQSENTEKEKDYSFEYERQVKYSCKYTPETENSDKETPYHFYIKGRACESCFELDGFLFMMVISVDLTATSVLMIITYRCNKKKTSDAPTRTPKAPGKPGSRGPPVPSADYETLNPNTRSADTYSTVVNRMG
ncbi:T-cell surface glycoprotein CD3 epsilon chain [Kryptolebias marmoratus]|uniref:T-cell surface glycoprotein CD3 epsilon chain-like n=1 Tax=Kryptolebias marmoratus TaxID=37003 RepID=A0A3Q3BG26_KRYMA|nr:T-cell surface glycoprotein CD3 epsilon chain [Kryptolebias marmoratus]